MSVTLSASSNNTVTAPPSEASAKLSEALDEFLADVERKFKNISDEILNKYDMAERCDRLEQEMLMREGGVGLDTRSKASLRSGDSLGEGSI